METNRRVMKLKRRDELAKKHRMCSWCSPHGGENARNCRKHGNKKPKYKDKR